MMSLGILRSSILLICACVMMGVNKFGQKIDLLSPTALFKEKPDKSRSFVNYDDNNSETSEWTAKNLRNRAEEGNHLNLNRKNSNNGAKTKDVIGEKATQKKVEERNSNNKKKDGPTQSRTKKESTERTSKPLFILHIGPPKTGTTTLQCELAAKFQKLRKENFFYLGTYHPPLCGLSINHTIEGFEDAIRPVLLRCYATHTSEGCDMDKKWNEFKDNILSHKDHNVIMSDEMFHHHFLEEDVKRIAKILNAHWNVRILYTYRHFYSSLPSMYHQLNDPYATQVGMPYAHEKTIWPEDGGYKIESFRNSNYFFIDDETKRFSYWTKSFDTVEVFNMHNTDVADYLPTFLCTMIPEAKSLCQQGSKKKSEDSSSHIENGSSSKYLHYDMLAVEAHEQGLLENSTKTREEVRDAVQEYCISKQWTSIKFFPLDCLSEAEMESFLHESLQQASILKRHFVNRRDSGAVSIDSEIRSGFKEYREKKKFCSVSTARTLEEYPWRQFFLHLD